MLLTAGEGGDMHFNFHFLNGETDTELLANLSKTMFSRQSVSLFGITEILLLVFYRPKFLHFASHFEQCLEVKLTVIWNTGRLAGTHTVGMDSWKIAVKTHLITNTICIINDGVLT